jgi:choline dehydrogenase-like flavoprotein
MLHTWESLGLLAKSGEVELESDVVVVGSGAGGAPLAYELSAEGYSVTVLEEGGYFPTESFRFDCRDAVLRMYRDGGLTFALGMPITLCPVGKTIGGTTTINQGTALRMPPHVLAEWRTGYGLRDLSRDELSLYYSAVEEFLYVSKPDPEIAGRNAAKFLEGSKRLGFKGEYLPRNAKDCEGYGVCCFGCPTGAKQSTNVSYIPEAVKKGAEVYADCNVERVLVEDGRAKGVVGRFVKHDTGEKGPRVTVHASVVVLACGTLGTPLVLARSRLANSSGQVGRNYRVHPCTQVVPVFEERIDPHRGISQSAWVHDFLNQGISLETTVLPPDMLSMSIPHASREHAAIMAQYPHSGLFGVMIKDSSSGRIIPRPGRRSALMYQTGGEDLKRMTLGNVVAAEIAFAAGAKSVYTMIAGHSRLSSAKDLNRLKTARINARQYFAMTGWHPMGTCRMGGDPEWSVTRHTGETWDVANLFISDGSVFPTSLGVNPQLTIMALSVRCAGFIDERLSGDGERDSVPEDDAQAGSGAAVA